MAGNESEMIPVVDDSEPWPIKTGEMPVRYLWTAAYQPNCYATVEDVNDE
jgi:hypothetical protein